MCNTGSTLGCFICILHHQAVTINLFYSHWHSVLMRLPVKIAKAFGIVPSNFSDLWIVPKKCYNLQHLCLLYSSTSSSSLQLIQNHSFTLHSCFEKNRSLLKCGMTNSLIPENIQLEATGNYIVKMNSSHHHSAKRKPTFCFRSVSGICSNMQERIEQKKDSSKPVMILQFHFYTIDPDQKYEIVQSCSQTQACLHSWGVCICLY